MGLIRKLTILLGALCLVAMTLVTCAEVVMRYVFNSPIFGSAEMIQMLLGSWCSRACSRLRAIGAT